MAVHSPYRSREQRRATAIFAALVLGALAIWVIAMVTTGSETVRPELFSSADLEATPPTSDPDVSGGTGADGQSENPAAGEDGEASQDGEVGQDPAADEDGEAGEDGQATEDGEVDGVDEGDGPTRTIDLEDGQTTWVAIVASLAGDDFTEAAARDRLDAGQQLLWSSHYPSLNPGLWVIVEGPFDTESEAARAARRIGNGAYPRVLTNDADDRYCALARGCAGEERP